MTLAQSARRCDVSRRLRWIGASAALVTIAALTSSCTTANQVPWETYDPALQQQIDSAALQKDCATLSGLHVKAHLSNRAHTKATGFSNAALISYIQTAQRAAGCAT
jgi:hypothetical protein